MERYLKKGATYGFLLGLGLAILFVDYQLDSGSSITYRPLTDYCISLLKWGVFGSFTGLALAMGWMKWREKGPNGKTYYLPFFFSIIIIVLLLDLGKDLLTRFL